MASGINEEEGKLLSQYVMASMDMPSSAERTATVLFEKWLRPVDYGAGTIKERVARLKMPIFAINGDKDWMEAASPAELPNVKFFVLPCSGHHLYFDNPAALARDILEELRTI